MGRFGRVIIVISNFNWVRSITVAGNEPQHGALSSRWVQILFAWEHNSADTVSIILVRICAAGIPPGSVAMSTLLFSPPNYSELNILPIFRSSGLRSLCTCLLMVDIYRVVKWIVFRNRLLPSPKYWPSRQDVSPGAESASGFLFPL